ncbi:MAG: hypothetical protein L6311_07635 [Cellulomonas sp.]|nr:hypothetical protein [Cellulomonas sp.]
MTQDTSGRATYRMLRLATLVVAVMLATSVLTQRITAGCWQTSISAYYWTAAHSVFVAALCAVGVALVVNKGNTYVEDVVLNYAGFFAFGVAMVPTPREPLCGGPGLPDLFDPAALVRNNMLAVLVAGVLAEAVQVVIDRRAGRGGPPWVRPVGWVVIAGFIGWFLASPASFLRHGHVVSAVTMFVGIIVVVLLNGFGARHSTSGPTFARLYDAVAAAMALTLLAAAAIALTGHAGDHVVIWVEALLILEFTAFWLVQTVELWDVRTRAQLG